MSCTIVAQVTDRLGHAAWYRNEYHNDYVGWLERRLSTVQAHPAAAFTDLQPGRIPIKLGHDDDAHQLGYVEYLEHDLGGNTDLRAVAYLPDLDADQVDGLYCSAEITSTMQRDRVHADECRLDALALVAETAGVGARPIKAFADYRTDKALRQAVPILRRAFDATRAELRWHRPGLQRIHRPTPPELRSGAQFDVRPYGPIEHSAPYAGIISVRTA